MDASKETMNEPSSPLPQVGTEASAPSQTEQRATGESSEKNTAVAPEGGAVQETEAQTSASSVELAAPASAEAPPASTAPVEAAAAPVVEAEASPSAADTSAEEKAADAPASTASSSPSQMAEASPEPKVEASESAAVPASSPTSTEAPKEAPEKKSVCISSEKKADGTIKQRKKQATDSLAVYRAALEQLNEQLADIEMINNVAKRCRVPPLAVAGAAGGSIVAFCLWGFCGQLISTLLGVMYPAFESFKAVEAFSNIKDPSNIYEKASNMQFWLIYWVVVAVFATVEYLFYRVLVWVPFYYPLKLAVLLWLYLPATRGANAVYHWIVAPTLRKNRHSIDDAIEKSGRHVRKSVTMAAKNVSTTTLTAGVAGAAKLTRVLSDAGTEVGTAIARRTSKAPMPKDVDERLLSSEPQEVSHDAADN